MVPAARFDARALRATSMAESFPWLAGGVTLVRVTSDGVVTQAKTNREKREMLGSTDDQDLLLAAWPGQWSQDVFVVDDLPAARVAVGLPRRRSEPPPQPQPGASPDTAYSYDPPAGLWQRIAELTDLPAEGLQLIARQETSGAESAAEALLVRTNIDDGTRRLLLQKVNGWRARNLAESGHCIDEDIAILAERFPDSASLLQAALLRPACAEPVRQRLTALSYMDAAKLWLDNHVSTTAKRPELLEPVVTLPWRGQQALLTGFSVTEGWAPSRTSAQRIADQHARYGTWLPSGNDSKPVWVGTPLRVHRRCDRPMFDISNTIAYDGLMVFGTPDKGPYPSVDGWINIRSGDASSHWIPAEGDALREVLTSLRSSGVAAADILVLSPFRRVVEDAQRIYAEVFPSVKKDLDSWVGTVHTMQGKEADAVVLILGGDPRNPGARGFATKAPNLLDVAVSRARRRLIVIGNRDAWGKEGCFTALADRLAVMSPDAMTTASSTDTVVRVWRTRYGNAYHRAPDCDALEAGFIKARENGRKVSTARPVPLFDAQSDGLMPCRSCHQ